ncbi:hypothetical protein JVU11DRAFT_5226 [Chiua virens]|nr:hypothetical protein JVU11DRAFT_5226 [Chiua virens]
MVRLFSLSLLALFAGAAFAGSTADQQVLEDTSLHVFDSWSYVDCGSGSQLIQIKSINVSPDPPKPGQDLTVTVTGTAVDTIQDGAYADVTVKLGIIKLLSKRFDVCDEARNANTTIQCPVEPGTYNVSHTVALPREIPQGLPHKHTSYSPLNLTVAKFTINVRGYTVDEDDMLCLDLKVDFMKFPFFAKLKLGKGKKLPSNVIDTSFKARSIALPTQSIAVEKDSTVPTNKRRQSLQDILSLFKHYSAGARKDAIFSARELFQDHPGLLECSIAPLLSACARLIGDEDASVRKMLLSFFDWMLASSGENAIRFLDLLMDAVPESVVGGWNESRLGHGKRILEGYLGILGAGTKFGGAEGLSILINDAPIYLIAFYLPQEQAQATSTASVILSPQSKLVVLQSLASFLRHAIEPQSVASSASHRELGETSVPVPTWFLRPSFASARLYEEHANVFQFSHYGVNGKHLTWNVDPEFECFDEDFAYDPRLRCREPEAAWDLSHLSDLSPEIDDVSRPSGDISLIMRLSRTLYPTLTATFLDGAPVVFSPSTNPTETEVQMLAAAVKITRTLYSVVLQSAGQVRGPCRLSWGSSEIVNQGSDLHIVREELKTLLDYLTRYFPFTPAHREAKASPPGQWYSDDSPRTQVEQVFQDLSVIYCELASLLVLVSHQSGTRNMHRGNCFRERRLKPSLPTKTQISFSLQADLVKSYVIRLLRGDGGSGALLPRPVSAAVYAALLPAIWALLNQGSGQELEKEPSSPSVLTAILDHAVRTSSGSAVKRLSIEFVGRLLLLEKEGGYTGCFSPGDAGEERKFQEWLIHLPKTLWEVGANSLATTQAILRVLLRLLQRGSCVMEREEISSLSSRLTPFFMVVHPIRGQILGPFGKIPTSASHVRRLALDLAASLVTDQTRYETVDKGLSNAVSEAVKGTEEELYWARVTGSMRSAWYF